MLSDAELEKFLRPDFNVDDWINDAFGIRKHSGSNEQVSTELIANLEKQFDMFSNVCDQQYGIIVGNLTSVSENAAHLKKKSLELIDSGVSHSKLIDKICVEFNASLSDVRKLDNTKNKIHNVSETLQEADNWITLIAEFEAAITVRNFSALCSTLVRLERSLPILADIPDYKSKLQIYENLKRRLMNVISEPIYQAIQDRNLDELRHFASILSSINSADVIELIYIRHAKLTAWKSFDDQVLSTIQNKDPLLKLKELFTFLENFFLQQVTFCKALFLTSCVCILHVCKNVIDSFSEKFFDEIKDSFGTKRAPFEFIQECKKISDGFVVGIWRLQTEHFSNVTDEASELYEEVVTSVYKLFAFQIKNYSHVDHDAIGGIMNKLKSSNDNDSSAVTIDNCIAKITSVCNEGLDRALLLSDGFLLPSFVSSMDHFLHLHFLELRDIILDGFMTTDEWQSFYQRTRLLSIVGNFKSDLMNIDDQVVDRLRTFSKNNYRHFLPLKVDVCKEVQDIMNKVFKLLFSDGSIEQSTNSLLQKKENNSTLFTATAEVLHYMAQSLLKQTFEIIFEPIAALMHNYSKLQIWSVAAADISLDLPSYSLIPTEAITKIGQYMLLLPQQIEQHSFHDWHHIYLSWSKSDVRVKKIDYAEFSSVWLDATVKKMADVYVEELENFETLTAHAKKQLLVDLEYLQGVIEDIGCIEPVTTRLLVQLLSMPLIEFKKFDWTNIPSNLTYVVSKLRNTESEK